MASAEIRDWEKQVDWLLTRCEDSGAHPADLLCEMRILLSAGPESKCGAIRPSMTQSSLELLLDAGAYESAALRLVSSCGFMVSGDGHGHTIASVVLPSDTRDYSFNALSETAAICGALAISLLEQATVS